MSQTAQALRSAITLRGSAQIVSEFFDYAINNILFQRGVYPPETFVRAKKYGLTIMTAKDEGLRSYLSEILPQVTEWLSQGLIHKLVIAISNVQTTEVLERWVFQIDTDQEALDNQSKTSNKTEKEISTEIQAIIRQITASVTFLPLLEDRCSFDILIYTHKESTVPNLWEESDPKYIVHSNEVRLRSFSTKMHNVDTMVAYRADDSDVV